MAFSKYSQKGKVGEQACQPYHTATTMYVTVAIAVPWDTPSATAPESMSTPLASLTLKAGTPSGMTSMMMPWETSQENPLAAPLIYKTKTHPHHPLCPGPSPPCKTFLSLSPLFFIFSFLLLQSSSSSALPIASAATFYLISAIAGPDLAPPSHFTKSPANHAFPHHAHLAQTPSNWSR